MELDLEDLPTLTPEQLVQAYNAAKRNGLTKLPGLLEGFINREAPLSAGESLTIRNAIRLTGGRQPITPTEE